MIFLGLPLPLLLGAAAVESWSTTFLFVGATGGAGTTWTRISPPTSSAGSSTTSGSWSRPSMSSLASSLPGGMLPSSEEISVDETAEYPVGLGEIGLKDPNFKIKTWALGF